MGGSESIDFLAPAGSGENTLVTLRERRLRRRPRDRARRSRARPSFPERLDAPEEVETPGVTTIEALAEFLGIDAAATSKAMPVVKARRHARARARPRRRPARGGEARGRARRGASGRRPRRRSAPRSAPSRGSLGPVGFDGEVVADEALREGQFVAGANRDGWHLRGVEAGRDYRAAVRRHPRAARGRQRARVRRRARVPDRDRGRPHLQARHALLGAARRDVPRRGRQREADRHGQLRHRPGAGHGRGGRAAPRRERDRLAASRSRRTMSTSSRCRARRRSRRRRPPRLEAAGAQRAPRRPRPAPGREVRRRRPDRLPGARDGRQEERSRTARSTSGTAPTGAETAR